MRRPKFVPSQRLVTATLLFAGALVAGVLVLLVVLQIRAQDRLDASETATATLAAQLRDMGIEPKVDVEDVQGDNPLIVPGEPGADGIDGINGRDGVDGRDGKDGARGPRGLAGSTGAAGRPGEDGVTVVGPQGPAGPEGPAGPQGPAGEPGADGAAGPAGDPGPVCPDGYTPRERNVISAEAPLGEPAIVCVKE